MSSTALLLSALLVLCPQEERAPLGIQAPQDSAVVRSMAPDDCAIYFRWAKSGEANPNSKNRTEALFADPEAQDLLSSLYETYEFVIDEYSYEADPETKFLAESAKELLPKMLANAGMVAITKLDIEGGPEATEGVLVIELAEHELASAKVFSRIADTMLEQVGNRIDFGDGKLYEIEIPGGDGLIASVGLRDGLLFFGVGVDVIPRTWAQRKKPVPEWLTRLEEQADIKQLSYLGYFSVESLIGQYGELMSDEELEIVTLLGLTELRHLTLAGGYDANGFVSRTRLESKSKLSPFFTPFTDTPLSADDLELIPSTADLAAVVHLDPAQYFERCLVALAEENPETAKEIREGLAEAASGDGPDPMAILNCLGEQHAFYFDSQDLGYFLGLVGSFEIDDMDLYLAQEAKVLATLEELWGDDFSDDDFGFGPSGYQVNSMNFRGVDIRYLTPRSFFSASPVTFCWAVVDDRLIVAPYPQLVKSMIVTKGEKGSLADNQTLRAAIEGDQSTSAMLYVEPNSAIRQVMPFLQFAWPLMQSEMNLPFMPSPAILPSGAFFAKHMRPDMATLNFEENAIEMVSQQTVPGTDYVLLGSSLAVLSLMVNEGMLPLDQVFLPSVAKQTAAMNQLRQLGLAMHNYADVHRAFPPAVFTDDDGNALLSWRVHILPYLDEAELYSQFHLDEPWDSKHNMQLIAKMPDALRSAGSDLAPGQTSFLTFRDENSIFPGREAIGFGGITDGTSNTIMILEANEASSVIWTKPEDLRVDPEDALVKLLGLRKNGFLAVMGDGSIHNFDESISAKDLMRFLIRNDGEVPDYELWR